MSLRFKTAYGVDASDRHVVIVRVRGGSVETLANTSSPNVPEALRRQIANDVNAGRSGCAAALPCHETVMRRISAPFPKLDRALKVFPSLLDVQLPFPLEQCAYVFTAATPNANGGLDALAIAARREDVAHALQRLGDAGIDPVSLDHEGLALWRQAQRELPVKKDAERVIVHLGPAHTTLVYGRGKNLVGAHSTRVSGEPAQIAARIQSWLRSQTELIVRPETAWIFAGASANDAAVRSALGVSNAKVVDDPATFLARALAARSLGDDDAFCNLRSGEQDHPQARRGEASRVRNISVLAFAAALLLCAINFTAIFIATSRNDAAQKEIQRIAFELTGVPAPKGQEVLTAQRALDEKSAALLPFQRMVTPALSPWITNIVQLCQNGSVKISQFSIKPDAIKLTLNATDPEDPKHIAYVIERGGWHVQTDRRDTTYVLEGKR